MATRTAEAQAVDAAIATLKAADQAWLAAGGNPRLLAAHRIHELAITDPQLAKVVRTQLGNLIDVKDVRGLTLEAADPGA